MNKNRIDKNLELLKGLDGIMKERPNGIQETEILLLQGVFYTLQDISISLAVIADKMKSEEK